MRKILILLLAVGVVACMVGAGSFALFNDVESSIGNTFTAGSLDMQLSNTPGTPGTPGSSESVTQTWVSPSNWAPGETCGATLHFNNTGTVDAEHIWFKFSNLSHSGSANLMDAIIVTTIQERFNSVTTGNLASYIAGQVGDKASPLTLSEFLGWANGWYGYYTVDDQSGDGIVIGATDLWDYDFILEFEFDADAGNEYQAASCSFDLTVKATQHSPDDGAICIHE